MDRRSHRPSKRIRTENLPPAAAQAITVSKLFANPDRDIPIPDSSVVSKKHVRSAPEIGWGKEDDKEQTLTRQYFVIVLNVQGSSAGAGSGEFHVYKASRRREYERLKQMEEAVVEEREEERFEREKREREERDAEKTRRNREKRAKKKKGAGKGDGVGVQKVVGRVGGGRDEGDGDGGEGEEGGKEGAVRMEEEEVGVVIHDDD